MKPFYMYMLECADGSYYVGHTDDLNRRLAEYEQDVYKGYVSARKPFRLVFNETFTSRYEALVAERQVKRWSRKKKEGLIQRDWDLITQLAKKINFKNQL